MKDEHNVILTLISKYLHENPSQRFGQALFNMNINQFADKINPESKQFMLRDIYNDNDKEILKRIR